MPSCPNLLSPQIQTELSVRTAMLCVNPPATLMTLDRFGTGVGVPTGAPVTPFPTCPLPLSPQAQTLPSILAAKECALPAATETTPLSVPTRTGARTSGATTPFPIAPRQAWPQAQTVPSFRRTSVCPYPAEI